MEPSPVAVLDALRPVIRTRWAELLSAAPPAPPPAAALVRPEMLVFLIDDTLDRFAVNADAPRRPRPGAPVRDRRTDCQCGLHLLLSYYLAGARALREILPDRLGPGRVALLHAFNRLAHDDMAALCGRCHHRGGPLCCLPPGPAASAPPEKAPA